MQTNDSRPSPVESCRFALRRAGKPIVLTVLLFAAAGSVYFDRLIQRDASIVGSSDSRRGRARRPLGNAQTTVDERTAVSIALGATTNMFPDDWLLPPHSVSASELSTAEFNRSLTAMKSAMSKYPAALLTKNLKWIYVVGSLEFDGIEAGGTNSLDEIYISNEGSAEGFSDRWLEEAFHHEFSSILLRNNENSFPMRERMCEISFGITYRSQDVTQISATTIAPQ